MMKAVLKPGGVCAVCIDDREIFRLGMMMDETFGEHNRLGIINWQKTYSAKNDSSHVSTATEYVLVYAKSVSTNPPAPRSRFRPNGDHIGGCGGRRRTRPPPSCGCSPSGTARGRVRSVG